MYDCIFALGSLHVENAVEGVRVVGLQDMDRHVVDGNSGRGFAIGFAVVGVAMDYKVGSVTVDDFGQTGRTKVGKDLRRFAFDGVTDGSVVNDDNALLGAKLRHGALQLQRFVDRGLHKGFYFRARQRR